MRKELKFKRYLYELGVSRDSAVGATGYRLGGQGVAV
jgi:hypothetical protein